MHTITTTAELAAFCESITHPYIAIDTEFVRERTYLPELCLVQLATPTQSALIDTLTKGLDLAPLWALLARKDVVKVLHAGRQDIEIFWALAGAIPAPLFDTQIAAMALGAEGNLSYSNAAKMFAGVEIDKSQQYTNWAQRPLSEKQLVYALADVTHLCTIYEAMKSKLEELGRTHWLEEMHAKMSDPETYQMPPEDAWKRVVKDRMKPRSIAALKHLAAWREVQAKKRNLPRGFILKDEPLQSIAAFLPKDEAALMEIRPCKGISPMAKEAALAAVAHARGLTEADLPKPEPRKTAVSSVVLSLLSMLLKTKAEALGVAPELIATREQLEDVLRGNPLSGWREEAFGEPARALLAGKLAMKVDPRTQAPLFFETN